MIFRHKTDTDSGRPCACKRHIEEAQLNHYTVPLNNRRLR
jgi:hypothetical protein